MRGSLSEMTDMQVPRRRLWSAKRCGVLFSTALVVVVGIVAWAGSVIAIHPVHEGRIERVGDAVNGGWRIVSAEGDVEKYGKPIGVTQVVKGRDVGESAKPQAGGISDEIPGAIPEARVAVGGYWPVVGVLDNRLLNVEGDGADLAEWESDEAVKVIYAKHSLWSLAWKAVGF